MGIDNLNDLKPESQDLGITPVTLAMSYQDKAREIVWGYVYANLDKSDTPPDFSEHDVYVVWFSKTLQNWKALVSTNLPDGMYYEVTYDGAKSQTYLDAYKKVANRCLTDSDFDEGVRIS